MGKSHRPKPRRLAEKLTQVRAGLDLSQNELLRHLDITESLTRSEISAYERGVREPPLYVILKYSRAAGISVETLKLTMAPSRLCCRNLSGYNLSSLAAVRIQSS